MMEGRGVTNFSTGKPSHGFTTSTTEFDDALIQRGIVSIEQAMMAKGAGVEDAIRLAEEKRRGVSSLSKSNCSNVLTVTSDGGIGRGDGTNSDDNDDVSDDDSLEDCFDDDDDFMQRYRQKRLDQLKQEHETKNTSELSHSHPSSILHICRENWMEEVNEASMDRWVVITMVEASGERRDRVVQELHRFAREFHSSTRNLQKPDSDSDDDSLVQNALPKLLTIDAADAIPNWPAERVPAIFVYRDGTKQHEWIAGRRGEFPPRDILEQIFREWGII